MQNLSIHRDRSLDTAALVASLMEERHTELHRVCIRWARGHHADAEDLLAEACLRAIQASQRGAAPLGNPIGWLTTIVQNLARDQLRAPDRKRRADVLPEHAHGVSPDVWDSLESKKQLARAAAELRRLPPAQRRSLLARAAGDDYPAIASALCTSPENARKLVQTARNTLRERLGRGPAEPSQAT
jgi:RNA polymerase sigma factor (sigma-70 family)